MQFLIGKITLASGLPEESVQGLRGVPESQWQESAAIGAESVSLYPRGNKKTSLTFRIDRTHGSAEEAADFCLRHEAQFPVQGLFTYRTDNGELYLPGAVAVVTQFSFAGARTTHSYRVVGGGFLTRPPSLAT